MGSGGQQDELFVMGASMTWWEGDQFGFHGGAMCKATLDFVEHRQSAILASLLQSKPAQRLQHCVDPRGVPEPVEDVACHSPLGCFHLGNVESSCTKTSQLKCTHRNAIYQLYNTKP